MSSRPFRLGPRTVSVQRKRSIREIHDRDEARRIIEAATEQLGQRFIRDLMDELGTSPMLDDDSAMRMLAQRLLDGTFVVVVHEDTPRLLDTPQSIWLSDLVVDGPGGEEPNRREPEQDATFVAFCLLDDDGTPISGQPFSLTLPDGRTINGLTDASGRFRFGPVHTSGSCSVRFGGLTG